MPISPQMIPLTIESIKTLAQRMNFVSFDTLQMETQSVQSHWYRHEEGLDLYYFQKEDGRLLKLHISCFGQVIEWNPLDGTRTGLLVEEEKGGEVFETVHYDARANRESVEQSVVIVQNANAIDEHLRKELLALLNHTGGVPQKREERSFFKRLFKRMFARK